MATTGINIKSEFNRKVGSAYSEYYTAAKLNALLNESLTETVEKLFLTSNGGIETDYIKSLISINFPLPVTANKILLTDVTAYNHLRNLQFRIIDHSFNALLIGLDTKLSETTIILSKETSLRTNEMVKLTGLTIDGTYYVRQIAPTKYKLYLDANFTIPVYDGVPFNDTGTVNKVVNRYATEYIGDTKIAYLGQPTIYYPKYDLSGTYINCYCNLGTVIEASCDYLQNITVMIDVASSTDYELTYPKILLYMMIDEASKKYAAETRDPSLYQTSTVEVQQENPQK